MSYKEVDFENLISQSECIKYANSDKPKAVLLLKN